MSKTKDLLFTGLLCASITFAGYNHTQAAQRLTDLDQRVGKAKATAQEREARLVELQAELESLAAKLATETQNRQAAQKRLMKLATTSKTPIIPKTSVRTERPLAAKAKTFGDIENEYAKDTIENLLAAGVLEAGDGHFHPQKTLTRGEFLEWMVKSTNKVAPRSEQIRLARSGDPTFSDVPADHPAFPYVQGAVNSGFVIGYDAETFRPEREISREEMIAIKVSFDKAEPVMNGNCNPRYTDFDKISPKYRQAIHNCDNSRYGSQTAAHIWGSIKVFRPQEKVLRSEAALCVERVKGRHGYKLLGKK